MSSSSPPPTEPDDMEWMNVYRIMMLTVGTITFVPVVLYRCKYKLYFQASIGILSIISQLVANEMAVSKSDSFEFLLSKSGWTRIIRITESTEIIIFLLYTTIRSVDSQLNIASSLFFLTLILYEPSKVDPVYQAAPVALAIGVKLLDSYRRRKYGLVTRGKESSLGSPMIASGMFLMNMGRVNSLVAGRFVWAHGQLKVWQKPPHTLVQKKSPSAKQKEE